MNLEDIDFTKISSTDIQLERQRIHLSLSQLAAESGISKGYLSKIENNKQLPSHSILKDIYKVFERYNPDNSLFVLLDYLRIRIPTNDVNLVIENILKMDKKFFLYTDSGFYGYIGTFSFADIRVLVFPTSDSKGTLIEPTGKGCRNLEAMLIAQNRNWYDFLRTTRKYNGNVTRIDLAIND